MEKDLNLEYALITGSSVEIEDFRIYPMTLREIGELGYRKYQEMLGALLVTKEMLDNIPEEHYNEIEDYDIVVSNCIANEEHRLLVETALSLFTREVIVFHADYQFFIGKGNTKDSFKIINRENFPKIAQIIREQNLIEKPKKVVESKESKKIRELREKMERGRQQVAKAKNQKTQITVVDLFSIVSVYTRDFNTTASWTIYQLNMAHANFLKQEGYKERFDMYLAGGDPKKLKLDTHWSREE